jgi:hypothetical protein
VTIWLKWGLLISFGAIFFRVFQSSAPAETSSIIRVLEYLAVEAEMELPPFVKFSLFFILQSLYLILIWLLRGLLIFVSYNLAESAFAEFNVALSVSAVSLIPAFWYVLPYGYFFAAIHSLLLTAYLLININRTPTPLAFLFGILVSILPLLF